MTTTARDRYLENQVLTATPQKLQLMLIDGALRFARQLEPAWQQEDHETAFESGSRCRKIIAEMLSVIEDDGTEVVAQTREIYLFALRQLTEAQLHRDADMIAEIIRLLEAERDVWQMVCEQMTDAPQRESSTIVDERREITQASAHLTLPSSPTGSVGFSLDA